MREERPIIFTIDETHGTSSGFMYDIRTKDPRADGEECHNLYADEIYKNMADLSEVLNNKGYAVLFEVG